VNSRRDSAACSLVGTLGAPLVRCYRSLRSMPRTNPAARPLPIRLAVWYGKGGVGKSTTTLMLSLLAAKRGQRVLAVDLDPECGTSRDFLGRQLAGINDN